jgi:thermostable 8-oxoguanine DNA glycosylase
MINPTTITNYNRTEAELEEFLVFAILVAGKTAKTQAKKLEQFLATANEFVLPSGTTALEYISYLSRSNYLSSVMVNCKLGQYNRLEKAFEGILQFKGKLKTISVAELESVNGIGSKTARFFVLHSQKDARVACLDVHILKWLREQGYSAPKQTPTKKRYAILEAIFLTEAWKREMNPADLDLMIWKSFSQKVLAQ